MRSSNKHASISKSSEVYESSSDACDCSSRDCVSELAAVVTPAIHEAGQDGGGKALVVPMLCSVRGKSIRLVFDGLRDSSDTYLRLRLST